MALLQGAVWPRAMPATCRSHSGCRACRILPSLVAKQAPSLSSFCPKRYRQPVARPSIVGSCCTFQFAFQSAKLGGLLASAGCAASKPSASAVRRMRFMGPRMNECAATCGLRMTPLTLRDRASIRGQGTPGRVAVVVWAGGDQTDRAALQRGYEQVGLGRTAGFLARRRIDDLAAVR